MHDHFHVQSARFGARALIAIGVAAALIAACQPAPATPVAQPPSQPEVRPTQPPAQPQTPAATSGIPAPFNDPSARPRVALVRELSSGSFFERYLAGAQAQARELGIELLVSSAEGDQAKLVANLETAIAQRVDAIIIDHGRGDVVRPTVQKALEAGIKVVTFDVQINLPEVPEIEQDDLLIGLLAARQLAIDSGGAGEVVYVNVNGFAPLDKRDRSWQDIKWRYPDLKEVARIGRVSANTAADTQTQFEAVIKSNPEARLVLAMYDEFAKGAVRAIEQAGLSDKYRVYSVDITNDDIQMMVKPGSPWKATVATDSYAVGRLSVRAAAALIAGEKVERYLLVQPVVITQEFLRANNVQDMDALIKAMSALGESPLVWPSWMIEVVKRNGGQPPVFAESGMAGAAAPAAAPDPAALAAVKVPEPFANKDKRPRVALVRELSSGSFFERYLAGAQAQARELGIELLVSSAEGDQAKLVANLETAIAQRVDAIIIDHGRGDVVRPTVQKALEAGIKVVTFDVQINLPEVPEIEQDDLLIGLLAARQLAIDSGGAGEVVYVNVNGFAPLDKRDRSWQNIKWRYPDLKEVARIGRVSANTAADTQTQFEAVIKSNPEARLVLAMYDEFAKGAVRAIEQAGLSDKYRVYSVDITNDDIQMMIKPGSPWKATVATDSYAVGRLSVRAAAALIAGEKVERYLLVQPVVITQEFLRANNVQDMDSLIKAMPALGESPLVQFDWMRKLAAENR